MLLPYFFTFLDVMNVSFRILSHSYLWCLFLCACFQATHGSVFGVKESFLSFLGVVV